MGDIEPCSDGAFHGVVHLLSDEQMAPLDKLESMYRRIAVNVVDYQDQSHLVYAYKMDLDNQPTSLPSERYLDITVKGCEYYNVWPEYINRLKHEQAVVPRSQPKTFRSFIDVPSDAFYSVDELARHNGSDPTFPLWVSVNGKILEYTGLPSNDHPEYEHRAMIEDTFFQMAVKSTQHSGYWKPVGRFLRPSETS